MPPCGCLINFILGCGYGNEVLALISHSFLYFIVRAGNGVFAIATLAIFSRVLSPAEYGVYALCMAIAAAAAGVLFHWLNVVVGRFYPVHLDDPIKVMGVAARGFWVASAVAALLFIGVLPFHEVIGVDPVVVAILFLITLALGRYGLALQVANAQSNPFLYGMLSWAKSGGALLAGFILIRYGIGERGALLGFLAGLVLAIIAFAPKPMLRMKFGSEDKRLAVNMFSFAWPLTFSHLASTLVDVADRVMIGSLLGVSYVAPYAVAYDLVQQSVGPIMNVLFLAAFPGIVQALQREGDESARTRLHALGSRLVSIGLPVAVGIGILASDISEIILGNGYRQEAAMIMPWLAAAIFVGTFKICFLDVVFQLRHKAIYQAYIATLMAVVNIVLNLLLLPRYGVIAAAWSTLAAFTVGALASWIVGRSVFAVPALGNVVWGSASASTTMAIVMFMLPASSGIVLLSAKAALGLFTYAVMLAALDVGGHRELLKTFFRQRNR